MATDDDAGFDEWVTDQGGPEAVAAIVAGVQREVEAGVLPGFTDKETFLAYLRRRDRRPA
jgi:hypothetical protein